MMHNFAYFCQWHLTIRLHVVSNCLAKFQKSYQIWKVNNGNTGHIHNILLWTINNSIIVSLSPNRCLHLSGSHCNFWRVWCNTTLQYLNIAARIKMLHKMTWKTISGGLFLKLICVLDVANVQLLYFFGYCNIHQHFQVPSVFMLLCRLGFKCGQMPSAAEKS